MTSNINYQKNIKKQTYLKLYNMLKAGIGKSKKDAIADGTAKDKIFSYSTYESYYKHCKYFINYINKYHPECTTLKAAKKYVNEWLQSRVEQVDKKGNHLSAWTIMLERQALGKLYGIEPDDINFFRAPKRQRENIKRSRGEAVRDKHFSIKNNAEFIEFCRGTGCRRKIIEKMVGEDYINKKEIEREIRILRKQEILTVEEAKHLLVLEDTLIQFPDQDSFIHHRKDKGGRERYSPIIGDNKEKIIERMKKTPKREKVWLHVPSGADIHSYRAEYATAIYKMYARPITEIPYDKVNKGSGRRYQSGVYNCRKDERGKKLDKKAMLKASKALGHNRIEVVANNYIRGI